ncbi:diguanylate cyclase [Crossiella sp. CA-258035]|uniref:diguanylate cyclase domain-containing protein n=1 Tax=Crossiella sp. CA-258035 TaxID=2981138 RepID=UPI0024BC4716|nr:diguanylate cyclase [Crossiella sp. CA-258035]WHT20752.1 diguanylate cyclase [Crossiella sp. CA-258035]
MAALGAERAKNGKAGALIATAWQLRWRAPELSRMLSERAAELAVADGDEHTRLRAETLTLFALNRLGQGVVVAERAVASLRAAEALDETELAWRLRVELANAARVVGAPLTGFAVLRPVLEAGTAPKGLRAAAMVQLVDCLAHLGSVPELTEALAEADQLYGEDPDLEPDIVLVLRGLLHSVASAHHRRWGDLPAAVHAAREGLALLDQLTDPAADSGHARARLILQLVCALLDSNRPGEARSAAYDLLEQAVRAPVASSVGWIRLALATRLYLPSGQPELAAELLGATADSAQRHGLEPLLAESLTALAHVHEMGGDYADALSCLRTAYAAERRRQRAVHAVRVALIEQIPVPQLHGETAAGLREQVTAMLRRGRVRRDTPRGAVPMLRRTAAEIDDLTGLLNQSGFRRRLDAVVNGGDPGHALTLVLFDVGKLDETAPHHVSEQLLRTVADRVRDTAPQQAAVARVGGEELAVLLPGATQDQAQRWAEQLRTEVAGLSPALPVTVNTGVAQHRPGTRADVLITEADRALARAKHATTPPRFRAADLPTPARRANTNDHPPTTHRAPVTSDFATAPREAPTADSPTPAAATHQLTGEFTTPAAAHRQSPPSDFTTPATTAHHTPSSGHTTPTDQTPPSGFTSPAAATGQALPRDFATSTAATGQQPPGDFATSTEATGQAQSIEFATSAAAIRQAPSDDFATPAEATGQAQPDDFATSAAATSRAPSIESGTPAAATDQTPPDDFATPTSVTGQTPPDEFSTPAMATHHMSSGEFRIPAAADHQAPSGEFSAPAAATHAASTGEFPAVTRPQPTSEPDPAPPAGQHAASTGEPESVPTGHRQPTRAETTGTSPARATTGEFPAPADNFSAPTRAADFPAPASRAATTGEFDTPAAATTGEFPAQPATRTPTGEFPAPAATRPTPAESTGSHARPDSTGRRVAPEARFAALPPMEHPVPEPEALGQSEAPLFFEAPTAPQPIITDQTPRPAELDAAALTGSRPVAAEPVAAPADFASVRAATVDYDEPAPEVTPEPEPETSAEPEPAPRPEPEPVAAEPPVAEEPAPAPEVRTRRRSSSLAEALDFDWAQALRDTEPETGYEPALPPPPRSAEPQADIPDRTAERQGAARRQEAPRQEPAHREAGHRELGHQQFGHHEVRHQEAGHREPGHQETAHQEAGREEAAHQDPAHQDAGHRNAAHQDPGHRDGVHQNAGYQDATHREFGHRDGVHQEFAQPEPRHPDLAPRESEPAEHLPPEAAPHPDLMPRETEPADQSPTWSDTSADAPERRSRGDAKLAELLAEALAAYETGRREDPETDYADPAPKPESAPEPPAPAYPGNEPPRPAYPASAEPIYPPAASYPASAAPAYPGESSYPADSSYPAYPSDPATPSYQRNQPNPPVTIIGPTTPADLLHNRITVHRAETSGYHQPVQPPPPEDDDGPFTGRCGPQITGAPDPFAGPEPDPFGYARAMDATVNASMLPEPPRYPEVEDPTEPQPRVVDGPREQAWTPPKRDSSFG